MFKDPFLKIYALFFQRCHTNGLLFFSGLEFAFTQSPFTLQATVTGFFYFFGNFGEFLGALLIPVLNTFSKGSFRFLRTTPPPSDKREEVNKTQK